MARVTDARLAVGNTSLADSVNLLDIPRCFIVFGGIKIDPYSSKGGNVPPQYAPARLITLDLLISNTTADMLYQAVRDIERKLWQAERALNNASGVRVGTPVCLWLRLNDSSNYVYFDVKGGSLDLKPVDHGASNSQEYTLSLYVLPEARGDTVVLATSGTLTNGAINYYVPNVPGDLPALTKLTIADVSAAGALPAPTGVSVSTATTGGTLAAASYGYRVTAQAGGGETTASTEVTVTTTGTTSANTVTWISRPTDSGYRVYGRTVGGELLAATLPAGSNQWIDTGSVTPSGALPVSNTAQAVINRMRVAVMSAPGLLASDYTPYVEAVALPAATTFTDATASGGTTARMTLTGVAQQMATITVPAGAYQAGSRDLWLRVRENVASLVTPGKPVITATASGTMPVGSYQYEIVLVDVSGNLSTPSAALSFYNSVGVSVTLQWTASGTYASTRFYYQNPSGIWKYYTITAAQQTNPPSYTLSADTGTVGTPPSSSTSGPVTQLTVFAGLQAPNPNYIQGGTFGLNLGNSNWEEVNVGTWVPPAPITDAGLNYAYQYMVMAYSTSGSGSLDIDGAWLLPHNEYQLRMQYTGLSTPRTWIADTRRDLRSGVVLTDGSGNVQGQAERSGRFLLGPGNNNVVVMAENYGFTSDVVNTKLTLQVSYTPRYRLPRGLV